MIESTAMLFYKIGHYRQASILMAEALLANNVQLSAWCGLGCSLANLAMGRASLSELAVQALKRSLHFPDSGNSYHSLANEQINKIALDFPNVRQLSSMEDKALQEVIDMLDVDPALFINAMEFIAEKDRMGVVMATGDLKKNRYLPILTHAIELKWDEGSARAALKRIIGFKKSPEIDAALLKLSQHKDAEEFNPYLSHAIKFFNQANPSNEGRASRSDSSIIQPIKPVTMSVLQKTSEVIEKGIESLGISAASTRGQQAGQWDFKRGSASVAVGVTTSERFPNGYFYVNSVLMDGSTVPTAKKEAFYKKLLDLNPSLINMKLCLSKEYVMLLSNRDANGLDPEEVAATINDLSYYADLLDDQLKEEFR